MGLDSTEGTPRRIHSLLAIFTGNGFLVTIRLLRTVPVLPYGTGTW